MKHLVTLLVLAGLTVFHQRLRVPAWRNRALWRAAAALLGLVGSEEQQDWRGAGRNISSRTAPATKSVYFPQALARR